MDIDWTQAGATVLSGLVIVFVALIILIAIVVLVSKLMRSVIAVPGQAKADETAPVHTASPPPVIEGGIDEETVAVISAAVACAMRDSAPDAAWAVTSIRRSKDARPAWGFAGMQQNTKPF